MSLPAVKTPPLPLTTSAQTPASRSASSKVSISASYIALVIAFFFSGRANAAAITAPSRLTSIPSLMRCPPDRLIRLERREPADIRPPDRSPRSSSHTACCNNEKSAYVQSSSRAMRDKGKNGAPSQNDPPHGGERRDDRRRRRVSSRGRARRHADRNSLWPRGGRDLGCGGRGNIRRKATTRDQSAHRPRSRHRDGATACGVRRRGRKARSRFLAWASDAGLARSGDLKGQPAGARRSRHRGASRAVSRNGSRAYRGGGRPSRGALRQSLRPREPDDRRSCPCRS